MSKRVNTDNLEVSGRRRKKQRTEAARTIAVQSSTTATNLNGSRAEHLPSSMDGLPSHIDVEKFAEARAFEIKSMRDAMINTRETSTRRVWQTLPRHLRRRAASHNMHRVPDRLRRKARSEMDVVRKITSGKALPRRGKTKRKTITEEYLRRQRDKLWLETHKWHAKRMKMENLWGYRLAIHTTEKSFRSSHRASMHGCILHDASYDAIIQLEGPEHILKNILSSCCDLQGLSPGAVSYSNGARACYTHLYDPGAYPFQLIGPSTIIWQPYTPFPTTKRSKAIKKQNKDKEGKIEEMNTTESRSRRLWIRCHALVFEGVYEALKKATSLVLDADSKTSEKKQDWEVVLTDFRHQLNIFDMIGPKSSLVIKGALIPVNDDERAEFKSFWGNFANNESVGAVPRGLIFGLEVLDPRLNFPPKLAKRQRQKSRDSSNSNTPKVLWPSMKLAASKIWDQPTRDLLIKPRFKKKDMDSRRAKHLIPGSRMKALRQDDRIPVLLVQHSIDMRSNLATSTISTPRSLHGWSLIVPKGWGMPFFSSLTYTGSRVGGQRERSTQCFEAGCLSFPQDYPTTQAYKDTLKDRCKNELAKHERKPPAKRPNWDKLGVDTPWSHDWMKILESRFQTVNYGFVSAQREADEMDEGQLKFDIRPWLLRGPDVKLTLDKMLHCDNQAVFLKSQLQDLRKRRFQESNWDIPEEKLFNSALVMINLEFPQKGSPEDFALICQPSQEEFDSYYTKFGQDSSKLRIEKETDLPFDYDSEGTKAQNDEMIVIGHVTSGRYSLSVGRARAVGATSIFHFLRVMNIAKSYCSNSLIVRVRNQHSTYSVLACMSLLE